MDKLKKNSFSLSEFIMLYSKGFHSEHHRYGSNQFSFAKHRKISQKLHRFLLDGEKRILKMCVFEVVKYLHRVLQLTNAIRVYES